MHNSTVGDMYVHAGTGVARRASTETLLAQPCFEQFVWVQVRPQSPQQSQQSPVTNQRATCIVNQANFHKSNPAHTCGHGGSSPRTCPTDADMSCRYTGCECQL